MAPPSVGGAWERRRHGWQRKRLRGWRRWLSENDDLAGSAMLMFVGHVIIEKGQSMLSKFNF